jgi:hypothetical protein
MAAGAVVKGCNPKLLQLTLKKIFRNAPEGREMHPEKSGMF